jgi:vitamin B12 transporter
VSNIAKRLKSRTFLPLWIDCRNNFKALTKRYTPGTHAVTGGCEQPDRNSKGLMMVRVSTPGFLAGFFVAAVAAPLSTALPAFAQSEITVFAPYRGIATPIARAGSAVSVITREEIEQAGPTSVAEILSRAPGVSFTSAGGFGTSGDVRIRGAENQHTMVLIDGVPVSNTTSLRNSFDFRTIAPDLIERIEVLRGPQSALYGSDSIGGVINFITRQAATGLSGSASVEGGSYGTHRETANIAYGSSTVGFFAGISHAYSDGFSRRTSNQEDDSTRQLSGFVRGSIRISETVRIQAQVQANRTESEFDQSDSDPEGLRETDTIHGSVQLDHDSFEGRWMNSLRVYGNIIDEFDNRGAGTDGFNDGHRLGAEWTSSYRFENNSTLLAGLSIEEQAGERAAGSSFARFEEEELYWAAFALYQVSLTPNLHVSAAARVDDFDASGTFVTGRVTAAYEIFETETTLRASAGTGANAPSLFQRFSSFGDPNLLPEESIGVDIGVNQVLFDGRLTLDASGFYNDITNLIDYNSATRSYRNISEVTTYGVELAADARIIPGQLDGSASYTYLVANDESTNLRLARRAEHEGQVSLTYIGIDRLSVTGTAVFTGGDWFNNDANTLSLDPFIRVDLSASYQAHEHLELFGRVENLFDADYQVRDGFNTPGLSAYAGVRATF